MGEGWARGGFVYISVMYKKEIKETSWAGITALSLKRLSVRGEYRLMTLMK